MRRTKMTALIGVALSLALISEAMAAPNATVSNKVRKGGEVMIDATNCDHGEDWTAYIDVTITKPDGTVVAEESYPTDPVLGNTYLIPMPNAGPYKVRVVCRHQFDADTSGTWWDETEDLLVTEITAAERRRCNKKSTRRARKRCLRRAAAD